MEIIEYILKIKKYPKVKYFLLIISFLILAIYNIEPMIFNLQRVYKKYFPEKFDKDNKFHVLILSFEKFNNQENRNLNIEEAVAKRLEDINEIETNKVDIIIDKNKKPTSSTEAKLIGKSRNADIVIFGEYYSNKYQISDDIRIRWILINDFELKNNKLGDSKRSPIERLSLLSDGFLLNDIEFIFYWFLGLTRFKNSDYEKAISYFNKLLFDYKPFKDKNAELYHYIALCYDKLEDFFNAKQYYRKTFEIDSNSSYAYNNYALKLAWNFSQYDSAKIFFLKAIKKSKNNPVVLSNYAWLLQDHYKDFDNAIYFYKKALEMDTNDANIYYNLAYIYDQNNFDVEIATKFYEKTIKIEPDNSFYLEQYAIFIGRKLEYFELAKVFHKKVIDIDSNYASPFNSLAHLSLIENDIISAKIFLEISIKKDSNFAEPYTVLGLILCQYFNDIVLGKVYLLKSINLFEKQKIQSNNAFMAYNNLAMYYNLFERNYKLSEKYFLKARELNPDDPNVIGNLLALYYFKLKDYKKANILFNLLNINNYTQKEVRFDEFIEVLEENAQIQDSISIFY